MTVTNPTDAVEAYVNEVRKRLADVPDEDRADLLDDVAAHVREIADEFGADELHARLGTPEAFTNELRASAGYAPTANATEDAARPAPLRRAWTRTVAMVNTEKNRETWRKIEPGWFVVRGVLLGYFALGFTGADPELVPKLGNNQFLGFLTLAAGAVVSYKLGDRRPATQARWVRRARIAAEIALVLFFVSYAGSAHRITFVENPAGAYQIDPCLRDAAGRPIGNLYAYDPSGQLIPQFFLTDQDGRPINNLCPDQVQIRGNGVDTEYARDVNGAPVYGVFPRKQTENELQVVDGNPSVTRKPVAPPAVVLPQLAPPTTATPTTAPPPAAEEPAS